jgi:hypothetical protein
MIAINLKLKHKYHYILLFYLITSLSVCASDIKPRPFDTLNYVQVLLDVKPTLNANSYLFTIESGDKQFSKKYHSFTHAFIIPELLAFGQDYTWSCVAMQGKKKLASYDQQSFHIAQSKLIDSNFTQQHITTHRNKELYNSWIVYDYGLIADKKGNPIWYMPSIEGSIRCLTLNSNGRITHINDKGAIETDLKGNLTWKAPPMIGYNIRIKNFHHDFQYNHRGNFVCLAELVVDHPQNVYSVIFEMDRNINLLWQWNEFKNYHERNDSVFSNHVNSFYVDYANGELYISNRNLNSITKVKNIFSGGTIDYHIGNGAHGPNIRKYENLYFSGQHAVSLMPDGNILLFNNNNSKKGEPSSVIILSNPKTAYQSIEKIWEHVFQFENPNENICPKTGDVRRLPNGNFLVSMGAQNRVFEMDAEGTILWENKSYSRNSIDDAFAPRTSYRVATCQTLYPTYFTAESHISKNKKSQLLIIHNIGSLDDSYLIHLYNEQDELVAEKKIAVENNSQFILKTPLNCKRLTIQSSTNPEMNRIVRFIN